MTSFTEILENTGGAAMIAGTVIARSHLDYAPRSFALKLTWEWFTDPIGFVMTRKMLLGIKQRAETSRSVLQP